MSSEATAETRTHRLRAMRGRNPDEHHRVATSLELLFDLTFVIAFSAAGNAFAHLVSEGHVGSAVLGFFYSTFAVCWAWVNFTWFASAYDTDDWAFRTLTMLQMIGVLILAMGLPALFHSLDHGEHVDNRTMVLGYIVMRVPMIFQWLRVAKQDSERRETALSYAKNITIAQLGWTVLAFVDLAIPATIACSLGLVVVELMGPWLAEKKGGTPWHAHHVAERYGLMAIITLGECLIGTIASISAEVEQHGWTGDAALVALAGTLLTLGMWWSYTLLPSAEALHADRSKAWAWGYGHILLFGAIAAVGGGLHVAASFIEGHSHVSCSGVVLAVAIPVTIFALMLTALHTWLVGVLPFHLAVKGVTFAIYAVAVVLASQGTPVTVCLVLIAVGPLFSIVADELRGARDRAEAVARLTKHRH